MILYNYLKAVMLFYSAMPSVVVMSWTCSFEEDIELVDTRFCSRLKCKDDECYHDCDANNQHDTMISMQIEDKEKGQLRVVQKMFDQQLTHFFMDLKVAESATSENCSDYNISTEAHEFQLHSSRRVNLEKCEGLHCMENCQDSITVEFNHVYTGCYYLTVTRYKGTNSSMPTDTCRQMIFSNYKKKKFYSMPPRVAPDLHGDFGALLIKMNGRPEKISVQLSLSYASKSNSHELCDKCLMEHSCCKYDRLSATSNKFQCQTRENDSTVATCTMKSADISLDVEEEVECTFNEMLPGNYCVSIRYIDDRCFYPAWEFNHTCLWTTTMSGDSKAIAQLPVRVIGGRLDIGAETGKGRDAIYIVIVTIVCFLSLLLVATTLALFYWRKRRSKKPIIRRVNGWSPRIAENIGLLKLANPKVFLLYPKDCDEFMEAMTRLRLLLKRANCEVFDYWDPEQYNLVASSPNAYLQLMLEKSVQVIVGASDCSRLLEKNMLGTTKATYKRQHCFDDLFLFGLQYLHQTSITDCYEKMHVVSLNERQNSNDVNGLAYINPLTVFTLPIHLEKLILALHGIDGSDYSIAVDLPEVVSLNELIKRYCYFREMNPNYLDDILDVIHVDGVTNLDT